MALFWKKPTTDDNSPSATEASFLERMRQSGSELMTVIGPEDGACVCGDWVGAVVSVSGNSGHWPSLEDALSDGVFHADCRHGLLPYTGENHVEAEFCAQLAVAAMQSRQQQVAQGEAPAATVSPTTARQLEFAKLYNLAQQADHSNAIETAYAKCKAALSMLEAEDIFGEEQAQVEQVLAARIRSIQQLRDEA